MQIAGEQGGVAGPGRGGVRRRDRGRCRLAGLGPRHRSLWLDGLIADLLATLVIFAASRLHRNSSFYDAYWSVLPPLLVVYWWVERSDRVRTTCGSGCWPPC